MLARFAQQLGTSASIRSQLQLEDKPEPYECGSGRNAGRRGSGHDPHNLPHKAATVSQNMFEAHLPAIPNLEAWIDRAVASGSVAGAPGLVVALMLGVQT